MYTISTEVIFMSITSRICTSSTREKLLGKAINCFFPVTGPNLEITKNQSAVATR